MLVGLSEDRLRYLITRQAFEASTGWVGLGVRGWLGLALIEKRALAVALRDQACLLLTGSTHLAPYSPCHLL